MPLGTVRWFHPLKGYGFIAPDDGGEDVYVHISAVEDANIPYFDEGCRVSFDIASEEGRERVAVNLRME